MWLKGANYTKHDWNIKSWHWTPTSTFCSEVRQWSFSCFVCPTFQEACSRAYGKSAFCDVIKSSDDPSRLGWLFFPFVSHRSRLVNPSFQTCGRSIIHSFLQCDWLNKKIINKDLKKYMIAGPLTLHLKSHNSSVLLPVLSLMTPALNSVVKPLCSSAGWSLLFLSLRGHFAQGHH